MFYVDRLGVNEWKSHVFFGDDSPRLIHFFGQNSLSFWITISYVGKKENVRCSSNG